MGAKKSDILFVFVCVIIGLCEGSGLRRNYYCKSCSNAERIIRNITWFRVQNNPALAASLLRLHFHDCFLRGCDGSILLDSIDGGNQSEKEAKQNRSLRGFEVIDEIKTEIENSCPGVVSCADILSLVARDAIAFQFKRSLWEVESGRRDGRVSDVDEVSGNIPSPFSNFSTLKQLFDDKGLGVKDLVALSGAHTIGIAHCGAFARRLYNFTGNGDADPSLNSDYSDFLRSRCPDPPDNSTTVQMDPHTPLSFDSNYYSLLSDNRGLFQSDAALLSDRGSAHLVRMFRRPNTFLSAFAASMRKLSTVNVLTGTSGEIRKNCRLGVVAEYNIPIYCNACERAIAKTISRFKGVESFITDKNQNKVGVWGQFDPTELLKKLRKKTGKRVEIVEREEVSSNHDVSALPLQIPEDDPYVVVFSDENTNSCIIL